MNKEQKQRLTDLLSMYIEDIKRKDIAKPSYDNMQLLLSAIKIQDDVKIGI